MLRAKVLPQVLEQALCAGVETAAYVGRFSNPVPTIHRLLDVDGSLLASAGKDGKVVAAIFANIWSTFQDNSSLEYILCELEVRVLSVFSLVIQPCLLF